MSKPDNALFNRISTWLRNPAKKNGLSVSRSLEEKEFGDSKLPQLLDWLRENNYSYEDVETALDAGKEKYPTQRDGAGLIRDAGGKQKFMRKKDKLLEALNSNEDF